MSGQVQKIFGFTPQQLVRGGLILLLVVTSIGSIIEGGALSGDYNQSDIMVLIPLILVLYLGIIVTMYGLGHEPSKFEMVLIPILIIVMIFLTLSVANLLPNIQNPDGDDVNSDNSVATSDQFSTGQPNTNPQGNQSINFGPNGQNNNDGQLSLLLQSIARSLTIIFLLAFLAFGLYWVVSRQEFDPDIQIHKVNEYTKSVYETNNTIIEYYIDASNKIERLKGRAPQWYSPTNFADHVIESPGPPLSSYFDSLTVKYEEARFGEVEMSFQDVEEVKDLHHQISYQIDEIFRKYQAQFDDENNTEVEEI